MRKITKVWDFQYNPGHIRICIRDDGVVTFVPFNPVMGDYTSKSIPPQQALAFMRNKVPVIVALSGGDDPLSNYENIEPVTLKRI